MAWTFAELRAMTCDQLHARALFHWPTTVQGVSYRAPPGCTCPTSPLYQRAIERERLRHGNRP